MNQESVSFRGLILSLAFYLIEEELRCHTLIFFRTMKSYIVYW